MTANTQPIFIKRPILWSCELSNQTVPGPLVGSSVPQFLGKAGPDGALIEEIMAAPAPGDDGNGYNDVTLFFFVKADSSENYALVARQHLPSDNTNNPYALESVKLPKLLSPASCDGSTPHIGLRIPPNASLYVGLDNSISVPFIVVALGGDY